MLSFPISYMGGSQRNNDRGECSNNRLSNHIMWTNLFICMTFDWHDELCKPLRSGNK
uniref:Uncharacterized protein n=1 Tax=Rhizophora mucronata TaxID=61149 RepID=A0A2P2NDK1_RHIMU